uniref:Uncharacterized protein n=1 Tax=Anopheles coluzzii TaxID=1518534 RepID=A0A8W7PMD0_ANOCL
MANRFSMMERAENITQRRKRSWLRFRLIAAQILFTATHLGVLHGISILRYLRACRSAKAGQLTATEPTVKFSSRGSLMFANERGVVLYKIFNWRKPGGFAYKRNGLPLHSATLNMYKSSSRTHDCPMACSTSNTV